MIFDKIDTRKPNKFELILLFVGIMAGAVGYFFVHMVIMEYGMYSFETTSVMLLWFIIIILIVLTAVNENSKEELKIIIKQQHDEMKLLREDMRRKK